MKKLPAKAYNTVFAFFMGLMMSCLMSAVVTWRNVGGFPPDYAMKWAVAWVTAFVVAFPLILVVAPLARRIALHFADNPFPQMVEPERDR